MNKMTRRITIFGLLVIIVTLPIGGCFLLVKIFGPPDVTNHASVLPRSFDHYTDAVFAGDPETNAYCYNLNTYITIPNLDTTAINVVNEEGQVPVFRFEDSVFVVLHKGRNYSRGLVLCADAASMANEYRIIEFQKLEDGLYYWELDGQRAIHEPDLYDRDVVTPK